MNVWERTLLQRVCLILVAGRGKVKRSANGVHNIAVSASLHKQSDQVCLAVCLILSLSILLLIYLVVIPCSPQWHRSSSSPHLSTSLSLSFHFPATAVAWAAD